jgi:hypothetical protein
MRLGAVRLAPVVALLALASCGSASSSRPSSAPASTTTVTVTTTATTTATRTAMGGGPAPGSCHARGPLPDPICTPGAYDPNVTQETIRSTICVPGWTATVRPPASYTDTLKARQIVEYGFADARPSDYEEEHFVPLELGGAPTSPLNLWPEAHLPQPGSPEKDRLENRLHEMVCANPPQLTLAEARGLIQTDWVDAYRRYVSP